MLLFCIVLFIIFRLEPQIVVNNITEETLVFYSDLISRERKYFVLF